MHLRRVIPTVFAVMLAALTFGGIQAKRHIIPVRFSHPGIIRYNHDGFIVHGKPVFIYSGSFHYFRCDPLEWMDRLEKIKAAGFNTIETYVPWNWTERVKGHPDFKSLVKFLDQSQRAGLYVIIRPGPYICAEWNIGGFPGWLEGKHVGFRTDSRASLYWSNYWYDEVMPVIRRHLITHGGNIILVQIENEYNYYHIPDSVKAAYVKALYRMAMRNNIDVPIITCWTKEVRDNTDPIFSQIMDACNFYPGWNINSTLPAIELMERQEPESPPMITELQGGWFSQYGDKTVRHVKEFGPGQITALTDFVMAHGIKALSYYMLYGGTNFGYWGSKDKTTSYDYTAPISEPGGLWSKYRAVKLIGDFIKVEGIHLIDAHLVRDGARSETQGVDALLRSDGRSGFLYVHNQDTSSVNAKVTFKSPAGSSVSLNVMLGPRSTYFLPVDLPLPGGQVLHYSNVPISAVAEHNGKPLIIAYGTPGESATISAGTGVHTEEIRKTDRLYDWDNLYVLLTTKARAAKSQVFTTDAGPLSLVSNSYLTLEGRKEGRTTVVDLQTRPGDDSFSLLGNKRIAAVSVDGRPVRISSDGKAGPTSFSITTPSMEMPKIGIMNVRARANDAARVDPHWQAVKIAGDTVAPLETVGDYKGGYTVYSGEFTSSKEGALQVDYYFNDWHSVLVDGKPVPGLTGIGRQDISGSQIKPGKHSIEIIYENQGWPNFQYMEQEKGLKSVSLTAGGASKTLDTWKYFPAERMTRRSMPPEALPGFNDAKWPETTVGHGDQTFIKPDQGWWFRTHLDLSGEAVSHNATITFKGVKDEAAIFVNGKFVTFHRGANSAFTVDLARFGKTGDNVIAVYVRNQNGGGGILRSVVFRWGISVPLRMSLRFHHSLSGKLANWQKNRLNDSGWKAVNKWETVNSADGITWYRGEFTVHSKRGWVIPWRMHFRATGSAQIWINGRLLGRYSSRGPQTNFYLPDGWIHMHGRNNVTFVLRPGANGNMRPEITEAYVTPYDQYVVRKHTLRVTLK